MSRPEFKIRPCMARDLRYLARLDADLIEHAQLDIPAWDDDHFMRATGPVKDGRFTIVVVDDTDVPQGYACWRLALDANPAGVRQRVGELTRLGVERSMRARGFGRRLVENVQRMAFGEKQGAEAIIVGVPERHLYVCQFFRHLCWPCALIRLEHGDDIVKFRLHRALARAHAEGRVV